MMHYRKCMTCDNLLARHSAANICFSCNRKFDKQYSETEYWLQFAAYYAGMKDATDDVAGSEETASMTRKRKMFIPPVWY